MMALAMAGCSSLVPIASASGSLLQIDIVDRQNGRVLPVYSRAGVRWIEGTPGLEYAIRVRNQSGGRVLAVMSVDGVNVITGDTAAPSQSGYVLDAYGNAEIGGWRKSMADTAAFYFTELPDAYATRTGRPDNVGVIGVAVYRERVASVARAKPIGKIAQDAERDASASGAEGRAAAGADASDAASGTASKASSTVASESASASQAVPGAKDSGATANDGALRDGPGASLAKREASADMSERREQARHAPALAPQLGTGHGRIEAAPTQRVAFERDSSVPTETITIRYDRRENLIALGIIPPPVIARRPDPFPGAVRFTPDPPLR